MTHSECLLEVSTAHARNKLRTVGCEHETPEDLSKGI